MGQGRGAPVSLDKQHKQTKQNTDSPSYGVSKTAQTKRCWDPCVSTAEGQVTMAGSRGSSGVTWGGHLLSPGRVKRRSPERGG